MIRLEVTLKGLTVALRRTPGSPGDVRRYFESDVTINRLAPQRDFAASTSQTKEDPLRGSLHRFRVDFSRMIFRSVHFQSIGVPRQVSCQSSLRPMNFGSRLIEYGNRGNGPVEITEGRLCRSSDERAWTTSSLTHKIERPLSVKATTLAQLIKWSLIGDDDDNMPWIPLD